HSFPTRRSSDLTEINQVRWASASRHSGADANATTSASRDKYLRTRSNSPSFARSTGPFAGPWKAPWTQTRARTSGLQTAWCGCYPESRFKMEIPAETCARAGLKLSPSRNSVSFSHKPHGRWLKWHDYRAGSSRETG